MLRFKVEPEIPPLNFKQTAIQSNLRKNDQTCGFSDFCNVPEPQDFGASNLQDRGQ